MGEASLCSYLGKTGVLEDYLGGLVRAMTTYTGLTTVSGIYLEGRYRLHLSGGVLARNPAAGPWWDAPGNHPAEVIPEGQADVHLRKISRWVLACEIEATKPILGRVKDYLEKVSLPLRLGTPATVALGGVKLVEGTLDQVLAEGLQQPAPVTYGVNCIIRLTDQESASMEAALVQLTYRSRFAVSLDHYLDAFLNPSPPQVGLKYLLALEAMFDPNGEQRGRDQRVSERASTFAATSLDQKRDMKRKLLQAYTHRGALQHGETRPERLQSARVWFNENVAKLQMIVAWSAQRVLRLHAHNSEFDPATYLESIPDMSRREAVNALMALPLYWVIIGKEFTVFNPMMWQASGRSIEYTDSGGIRIDFPNL